MSESQIVEQLKECFKNGNKLLICGNGGSMAQASHFAEELITHGYPAIALADPNVISALANDFSYEEVFSRYIIALANQGDVLIALSTSGKSKNILRAIRTAYQKHMIVIDFPRDKGKTTETIQNYQLRFLHRVYKRII